MNFSDIGCYRRSMRPGSEWKSGDSYINWVFHAFGRKFTGDENEDYPQKYQTSIELADGIFAFNIEHYDADTHFVANITNGSVSLFLCNLKGFIQKKFTKEVFMMHLDNCLKGITGSYNRLGSSNLSIREIHDVEIKFHRLK